jgi:hypothetical protein
MKQEPDWYRARIGHRILFADAVLGERAEQRPFASCATILDVSPAGYVQLDGGPHIGGANTWYQAWFLSPVEDIGPLVLQVSA